MGWFVSDSSKTKQSVDPEAIVIDVVNSPSNKFGLEAEAFEFPGNLSPVIAGTAAKQIQEEDCDYIQEELQTANLRRLSPLKEEVDELEEDTSENASPPPLPPLEGLDDTDLVDIPNFNRCVSREDWGRCRQVAPPTQQTNPTGVYSDSLAQIFSRSDPQLSRHSAPSLDSKNLSGGSTSSCPSSFPGARAGGQRSKRKRPSPKRGSFSNGEEISNQNYSDDDGKSSRVPLKEMGEDGPEFDFELGPEFDFELERNGSGVSGVHSFGSFSSSSSASSSFSSTFPDIHVARGNRQTGNRTDWDSSDSRHSDTRGSNSSLSNSRRANKPHSDRRSPDNRHTNRRGSDSRHCDTRGSNSSHSNSRSHDKRHSDRRSPDKRHSDNGGSDNLSIANRSSDSRHSDGASFDSQSSDTRISDSRHRDSRGPDSRHNHTGHSRHRDLEEYGGTADIHHTTRISNDHQPPPPARGGSGRSPRRSPPTRPRNLGGRSHSKSPDRDVMKNYEVRHPDEPYPFRLSRSRRRSWEPQEDGPTDDYASINRTSTGHASTSHLGVTKQAYSASHTVTPSSSRGGGPERSRNDENTRRPSGQLPNNSQVPGATELQSPPGEAGQGPSQRSGVSPLQQVEGGGEGLAGTARNDARKSARDVLLRRALENSFIQATTGQDSLLPSPATASDAPAAFLSESRLPSHPLAEWRRSPMTLEEARRRPASSAVGQSKLSSPASGLRPTPDGTQQRLPVPFPFSSSSSSSSSAMGSWTGCLPSLLMSGSGLPATDLPPAFDPTSYLTPEEYIATHPSSGQPERRGSGSLVLPPERTQGPGTSKVIWKSPQGSEDWVATYPEGSFHDGGGGRGCSGGEGLVGGSHSNSLPSLSQPRPGPQARLFPAGTGGRDEDKQRNSSRASAAAEPLRPGPAGHRTTSSLKSALKPYSRLSRLEKPDGKKPQLARRVSFSEPHVRRFGPSASLSGDAGEKEVAVDDVCQGSQVPLGMEREFDDICRRPCGPLDMDGFVSQQPLAAALFPKVSGEVVDSPVGSVTASTKGKDGARSTDPKESLSLQDTLPRGLHLVERASAGRQKPAQAEFRNEAQASSSAAAPAGQPTCRDLTQPASGFSPAREKSETAWTRPVPTEASSLQTFGTAKRKESRRGQPLGFEPSMLVDVGSEVLMSRGEESTSLGTLRASLVTPLIPSPARDQAEATTPRKRHGGPEHRRRSQSPTNTADDAGGCLTAAGGQQPGESGSEHSSSSVPFHSFQDLLTQRTPGAYFKPILTEAQGQSQASEKSRDSRR